MLRLLNNTASRRLMGLALAGALAFSAASFAMPNQIDAADDTQGCRPPIERQQGDLDTVNVNASLETTGVDARIEIAGTDARVELLGVDGSLETTGVDLTASAENLVNESDCQPKK